MKFFINNKLLVVDSVTQHPSRNLQRAFDTVCRVDTVLHSKLLLGRVIFYEATAIQVFMLLELMESKKLKKLESITFAVSDPPAIIQFIKDRFKLVKAAGGIVLKDDLILMIYRLGRWDLPKGKLEKKEKTAEGAQREVEEECSIRVTTEDKLCVTYHSYSLNGNKMMKKTTWYVMRNIQDNKMRPQMEEGITRIQWMNKAELKEALKNSYPSIVEVITQYYLSVQQGF